MRASETPQSFRTLFSFTFSNREGLPYKSFPREERLPPLRGKMSPQVTKGGIWQCRKALTEKVQKEKKYVKNRMDHRRKLRHRAGVCTPLCKAGLPAYPDRSPHREEDCQRLFRELEGETIDIFINNAGFGVCGSYLETDDAREEEMIRVNVEAMARLFRFAVRRMHAAGGGTILNVASSAGLLPGGPYMAGYYASKAYVVSLTRGVARELQELHSPVYVCALCPGPVDTEFNDRAGVVFALRGITPEFCVQEAMHGMMHRRTIIVPSAFMRACTTAQKLLPASLLMPIVARQQKKKMG